jgi:hypothetical protein
MFGCIGRLVVLGVLLVAGAVAYLTRASWEPTVRARLGLKPAVVAAAPAWEPVTPEGALRVRTALDGFRRPTGPAFMNVHAGDLVAFAFDSMMRGWRSDAGRAHAEALAGENVVSIRGTVAVKDLGGVSGPLAGVLDGDQPIEVRGRFEVAAGGGTHFRVERIALKSLVLPSAAIGAVVRRLAPAADGAAIPLALPRDVADIRVTAGRITLYKAAR